MTPTQGFTFDFHPGTIVVGAGCVGRLGDGLDRRGLERAVLVSGRTVGTTAAVVDPIREGLGDRLVAEFPETTPAKTLGTALAGLRLARDRDVDAVVAVGGGSTLDTAKVLAALSSHADGEAVAERALDTGALSVADGGDPLPIVAVPTTLAGADLSDIAGVTLTLDRDALVEEAHESGGVGDPRLMPEALYYDPDLYRTTPASVLAASAMNGFDKGIEMLYSPHATPITDGTAARGLRLLQSGLGTIREEPMDAERLGDVLAGVVNVQYGLAGADGYRASIIHAFGHGFSHGSDVHQGTIHGVLAPYVLRYVFDSVDGRRDLLAEALGVDAANRPPDAVAAGVIDAVAAVRDDLGLPNRLRDVEGVEQARFPEIAAAVADDDLLSVAPEGVDPSVEEIVGILERAW
ncbi:iron-containing alcohol dehydrogenase family protein [Halobellus limi]|uniref:Alcohol dehydrogenase n=1 Tax=Halobellus limi TaxID=699433 RepID=A0A1H6B790_9EURY|nr:iron-containing alcohol dehydrogenase family protein [Halobellus limi]QCC49180.1 iron-containing alcohol dehydrogenase [Halobellus limi]SEG56709.1 alcohol dehydrogenase [Halobellus limi]